MLPTNANLDWTEVRSTYAKLAEDYIKFGQACARINGKGATQEEIAEECEMSQESVTMAIAVGRDPRIIRASNKKLPKSTYSLYLLTTLDDKGFDELAKPDTTVAQITSYKRALAAPTQPDEVHWWARADAAHAKMVIARIELCRAMVELHAEGVTLKEIAKECDMSLGEVAEHIEAVSGDTVNLDLIMKLVWI